MPAHAILFDLIAGKLLVKKYNLLQSPVTLSLLIPNIFLSTLF